MTALHKNKNQEVLMSYQNLCEKVRSESAKIFNESMENSKISGQKEKTLKGIFNYFFKLDGSQHILAGTEGNNPFAVLVPSLDDGNKKYKLLEINAEEKKRDSQKCY